MYAGGVFWLEDVVAELIYVGCISAFNDRKVSEEDEKKGEKIKLCTAL